MKKILAFSMIAALFLFAACKKSEEKKEPTATAQQKTAPEEKAGKERPKRGARNNEPAALEIFNETNLVASISPDEYDALATNKIKVGKKQKEVEAALLSDLLKKYNVSGKNVVISGPAKSVPLTWDQATKSQVYIFRGPKNQYQIANPAKDLTDVKFPAQVIRIQIAEKVEAASAEKPAKKPAKAK